MSGIVIYYDSRKRERLRKRRKNEYRYDERLKTKDEESKCLAYTGLYEELEHLKIKKRMGEPSIFKIKRKSETLAKILSVFA